MCDHSNLQCFHVVLLSPMSLIFFFLGYGNLSPVTTGGRVICVIYALLGIPLTLALLAIVGKILGDYINDACAWLLKWYRKVHKSYEYERT